MKSPVLAFALTTALVSASILSANESPLFLSLTRRARPLDDMPSNVSVITAREMEQKNARTVGEALTGMTGIGQGVYGTYGANNNLMLRGSSAEQVLVMIDGRRVNDPAKGLTDVGSIPVDRIDHIEIIRGGTSAVYGSSAFGGTVNIITRRHADETPAIDAATSYGDFNTRSLSLGLGARRGALSGYITGGKLLSDGWRQNSDYDSRDVFVRLGYDAGTYGSFDFSGSLFRSEAGVPGIGASLGQYDGTIERTASTPTARQDQDDQYARMEHQKQWQGDTLKTVVYASRSRINYKVPEWFLDQRYTSLTWGGEIQLATGEGTTVGGEWWEDNYIQSDEALGADTIDRARISSAGYFLHELRLDRFSAIPGIRFDNNSSFGSMISPKITLLYRLNDQWKVSANTGRSWRAPTINELYWPTQNDSFMGTTYITRGNTGLLPEEGITSDLGAEFAGKTVQGKCTVFLTESKDIISWQQSQGANPSTFITEPTNISRARQAGLEMEFNQRIVSGLYHRINYAYLWAENTDNGIFLPYRPRHTINYETSYLFPWNTKLSANVRYYSEQETGSFSPAVARLPGYTLTGCRVSQKLSKLEIWMSVDNIADIKYQTRLGYPLPGRTLAAGLSARL